MKYLLVFSLVWFTANISLSQFSSGKEYKYTISFEEGTFENTEAKELVRDFRNHVFSCMTEKFNFNTRYNELGTLYFETSLPIKESIVMDFFTTREKQYISFSSGVKKKSFYAFNSEL
jgi:hypothetical protein